ncbi:helix-turn-helix transcriptional regulator [Levilactobacillus brevis]|uniref:helix-turn-helix transcriptional regulator n=1 Tax=Levilactobacillus brevis TaxID=1580 RepID=UPI00111ACC02|nr:helix-turn-helix transcriptional regulator [Levilactobacillus brevis]QCZ47125.1 DNA-binding helix-turn-helix protein [Levilactobacillus brevis]
MPLNNRSLPSAFAVVQARKQAKLTQEELAALTGLRRLTIIRIENGQNTSVESLEKIARALNMKLTIAISEKNNCAIIKTTNIPKTVK